MGQFVPDERIQRIAAWLRDQVGEQVEVLTVARPGAGLSQETLLCDARWAGQVHNLVLRSEPGDEAIFPDPSTAREFSLLAELHQQGHVPVPRVRWLEADAGVLGQPFFVMDRVPGRIPTDDPPFMMGGFVYDATPTDQARLQHSTVDVLATIHRADLRGLGKDLLDRSDPARSGIERELCHWQHYLDWAEIDGSLPLLRTVYDWCADNRPLHEPASVLCWGDARYGNVVYAPDFTVASVLDWEMATLGPPELDLGWFLFLHDTALMWMPDLPGFAARDAIVERYETSFGRAVADLRWYEVWAGLRAAAIQARIVARAHAHDPAVPLAGREQSAVVASLRRLIDLPD